MWLRRFCLSKYTTFELDCLGTSQSRAGTIRNRTICARVEGFAATQYRLLKKGTVIDHAASPPSDETVSMNPTACAFRHLVRAK
jgi:hypothetical protein